MRVSLFAFAAAAATVSARSLFPDQSQSPTTKGGDDIPGDSPLKLCSGDHYDDLVQIESVDLFPNPPQPGASLLITASGTVRETIEEGAYVNLQVKYGLIRLISTKADLCEQIGNVDMKCPIKAGAIDITKAVDLPNEIPPGKYTVFADVYSKDDEPITCLTATVVFSMGGLGQLLDIEL